MIFEEFVLHNFGIYKDRHVVKLSPSSPKKSIILLGGLNGSGKTTLLDALQLTLYGKFAKYSNRGSINYFDYLGKMINYHVKPTDGAALELQFKHFRDSKEETIRIHRSWCLSGKSIKETVEIKRDGVLDPVITSHWYEYIEEFIPAEISNLFFFDGEKIEAFADPDKAAALLKTGIHALLGLNLVDRLSADLLTVERKRKIEAQSKSNRTNIIALEKTIESLEKLLEERIQQKSEKQDFLKQLKNTLEKLKEEYRREGGELFEQRSLIEAQLKATESNRFLLAEQLREIAIGEAPLLMVPDLLCETEKQAILEKEAKDNRIVYEVLNKRDTILVELLTEKSANKAAITAVKNFMAKDQAKREHYLETECYLNIDPNEFSRLQKKDFNKIIAKAKRLIKQFEEISEKVNDSERQLVSIPDPESLEGITQQLADTEKDIERTNLRIETLEQEHLNISNEITRKKTELNHAYEMEAREQFANENSTYVLKQSKKVRSTLDKFRFAMTQKHIRQLEALILDSFQHLIRKDNFITSIEIDPSNYTLTLYTSTHESLPPDTLSAGERQLLAVSILWGLSRASKRPLPAIIDTPLSRLDGKHRKNLVENYFYQASHQVILLSTDEEINDKYYRNLKPAIEREYHISYVADKQSSVINDGYFF